MLAAAAAATLAAGDPRPRSPADVVAAAAAVAQSMETDVQFAKAEALRAATASLLDAAPGDAGARVLATLLALARRPLATPLSVAITGRDEGGRARTLLGRTPRGAAVGSRPLASSSSESDGDAPSPSRPPLWTASPPPYPPATPPGGAPPARRAPAAPRRPRAAAPPGCLAGRLGCAASVDNEEDVAAAMWDALSRGAPGAGPPPGVCTADLSRGATASATAAARAGAGAAARVRAHCAALAAGPPTAVALGVALAAEVDAVVRAAVATSPPPTLAAASLASRVTCRRYKALLTAADAAAGAGDAAVGRLLALARGTRAADAGPLLRLALAAARPELDGLAVGFAGDAAGAARVGAALAPVLGRGVRAALAAGLADAACTRRAGLGRRVQARLVEDVLVAATAAVAGVPAPESAATRESSPPASPRSPQPIPQPSPLSPLNLASNMASLSLAPAAPRPSPAAARAAVSLPPPRPPRASAQVCADWNHATSHPLVVRPAAAAVAAVGDALAAAARAPQRALAAALEPKAPGALSAAFNTGFLLSPDLLAAAADAAAATFARHAPGPRAAAALEGALRDALAAARPGAMLAPESVRITWRARRCGEADDGRPREGAARDARALRVRFRLPPCLDLIDPSMGAWLGRVFVGALGPARAYAALTRALRADRARGAAHGVPATRAATAVLAVLRALCEDAGGELAAAARGVAGVAARAPPPVRTALAAAARRARAAAARAVWCGAGAHWPLARAGVDAACDAALALAAGGGAAAGRAARRARAAAEAFEAAAAAAASADSKSTARLAALTAAVVGAAAAL